MSGEVKQFKTFRDLGKISKESSTSTTSNTSTPSRTSSSSTPSSTRTTNRINKTSEQKEISPQKDYQKIPNSITREAIPAGIFRGKSKVVYDYLWSQSRGAIKPSRIFKVSRRQIKEKTAIGSMVTIDAALSHLHSVGLIRKASAIGSATGNEYEIFAPDELPSSTSRTSTSKLYQKVDELDVLESGTSRETQVVEKTAGYKNLKTIFKDIEPFDDDSPVYAAFKLLESSAKRATGKSLSNSDWKAFLELIEVFVNETDLATARSKSVSSYMALGVENLRRRLYPKRQPKTTGLKDWKSVGKAKPGVSELSKPAETLNKDLRQTVLKSLQQMVEQNGRESVEVFKTSYTMEDWNWLMNELEK